MGLRTFLSSILVLISLCGIASTQEKTGRRNETGLLLETTFIESTPPSYQPVGSLDSQVPGGSWYARFGRVKGWQLPSGDLPIRAVRIFPYLNGETVTVEVSVLRGTQYHDAEDHVATFTPRENEKFSVKELLNFGVEPFELRLLRVPLLASNLPAVENKTLSLEVVGIEPQVTTVPSYKLTFRNISKKSINAIILEVRQGDRVLSTGMPRGFEGKQFIPPGETVEWRLALVVRGEGTTDNHLPSVLLAQRIVIPGLRFSDGTIEGVFAIGLDFQAEKYGRKTELRRIVRLLESAIAEADSSEGPAKLRRQIEALTFDFTDEEQVEMTRTLAVSERTSKSVQAARHAQRTQVLEQLRRFPPDAKLFRSWLLGAKESYSNYLLRLESVE